MTSLAVKRKRDAFGPIRGFVYQVELTIQRWLKLDSHSLLELERGEDVDTIQDAMLLPGAQQARLLEQIKARESKLTLRSASAIGALASFYEHELTNPLLRLTYRYVTNAAVGVERPSPVPGKTPLVTVWKNLQDLPVTDKTPYTELKTLRNFLESCPKPEKLNLKTWRRFASFVKSTSQKSFYAFVRKVEWLPHQTPTELVAQEIQNILTTQYGTDPQEARMLYALLFLHVFKLLSQSGIKRLSTADRDLILAKPRVDDQDRALLTNLEIYLSHVTERIEALEEDVASLKSKPLPSPFQIQDACGALSTRIASVLVDGQSVIERLTFQNRLDSFLKSQARYCFVLGPSGVGKSISIATQVERLTHKDRALILTPGKSFSLEETARLVAQELPQSVEAPSWQKLIEIISDKNLELLLFIDAIDEASNLDELFLQLSQLHYSIGAVSAERLKVIISCRDIAWSRFRQQRLFPVYQHSNQEIPGNGKSGGLASVEISLSDFTVDELDLALIKIDANELLEPGRFGQLPSAHVLTLRDLLKHPATFSHYAALKRDNSAISIQNITWSYLIEQRLDSALEKCARQCGKDVTFLRNSLITLAKTAWESSSKNFELDIEQVWNATPTFDTNGGAGKLTARMALIENRVLSESAVGNRQFIRFHNNDIGAYLLSLELEHRLEPANAVSRRATLEQWLTESWNFQPLLDSMLAMLDRWLDQPHSSQSLAMVEVLVESNRFYYGEIFGLMRPQVLKTIFDIIRQSDDNDFYGYRNAALNVRPNDDALQEIRVHLNDENSRIRQLAAELAGAHRDGVAIARLIQLLRDGDDDVKRKAYRAFGHIGVAAIKPLCETIQNRSKGVDLRASCLNALRSIGFRDSEVSAAIKKSLKDGGSTLTTSGLLTSAHLRDRGHLQAASEALTSTHSRSIQAAAKYLAEVPSKGAYQAVKKALTFSLLRAQDFQHFFNVSQLMVALFNSNQEKARDLLTDIYRAALEGRSRLTAHRAIQISPKFDAPFISALNFKGLVEQLQVNPEDNSIWQSADIVSSIWQIDHLDVVVDANRELEQGGLDTAKLFVDAIIPGITINEEFRIGNQLNRTSDLRPVIKSQSRNFAIEAARLLRHSGILSCMDLCRWLWVSGDTRSEADLLYRFENPSEEREAIHERSYIARALATCGKAKGARAVINYVENKGEELEFDFARTTLFPLLIREQVSFDEVINIALNPNMNWWSRSVSVIALSQVDHSRFGNLFADLAETSSDEPRLQTQVIRSLGLTKDKSHLPKLQRLLRESEHLAVKEQAAECLTWLDDDSSVHDIERALEDSPAQGFASALAHFRQETSLPILLNRLNSISPGRQGPYIKALSAFWKYSLAKASILEQFDGWSPYQDRFFGNQSALIDGMAEHEPDVILNQFNKSFDDGYLTTDARETMALWVARLLNLKTANHDLLLEASKRLVCDQHVPARELAANALRYARPAFALKLFQQLHDSPGSSEWERQAAVYCLGFWKSPIDLINDARFDREFLVRKAADSALEMRSKQKDLAKHFKIFVTREGVQRLSSYMCLADQGNHSTIWALHDEGQLIGLPLTFRKRLANRIKGRLTTEYKKKAEEEKQLSESRGTITFD